MTSSRAFISLAASGSLVAALLAAGAGAQTRGQAETRNPCHGEEAAELLCPDLRMAEPTDIDVDRRERPGRRLLRSTSSLDSRGEGPASLRGVRDGRKTMRAYQVIERRRGRRELVRTGARLYWMPIPGQGRYWKWRDAARFELWKLDRGMRKEELVRVGPKQIYCLRDLELTRRSRRSPLRRVYPACSQDRGERKVTLGTSVGWSDVYPAGYHQNWIDVTGLPRGRYLYVHIADPRNRMWELDEDNNESNAVVWLPSGKVLDMEPNPPRGRDRGS